MTKREGIDDWRNKYSVKLYFKEKIKKMKKGNIEEAEKNDEKEGKKKKWFFIWLYFIFIK